MSGILEEGQSFCGIVVAMCTILIGTLVIPGSAAMEGVERLPFPGGGWEMVTLPDGRMMVWNVDNDVSPNRAYARYSSDNGYTWTESQLLFEFPQAEVKFHGGNILCDRNGTIHLFGLQVFDWSWGEFAGHSQAYHVMSTDGGESWTDVQYLDFGHDYSGGFLMQLELSSGRLVVPVGFASEEVRSWGTAPVYSDDGGQTWQRGEDLLRPDVNLDEAVGLEMDDGRVWMLFRTNKGYQYQCYMLDGGQGWSEPELSRFVSPSAPAGLLRLSDGRIVACWNNSLKPKHVFNRLVLAMAISDDDGKTWSGYREIARTDGIRGPDGWVTYPRLAEDANGQIIAVYAHDHFKEAVMIRVDPDWLEETAFSDDFSEGLGNWLTVHTEGVTVLEHPKQPERQVLRLRKPNPEVAAGASLNFPFGQKGHLTMRLRLQPGFQGARICLTDHFTWPYYAEDGRFGISLSPGGQLSIGTGESEFASTEVTLATREWHTLGFTWDCEQGECSLTVDDAHVADLPQISRATGLCYLRLWSAAEQTDRAGLAVDNVSVNVEP